MAYTTINKSTDNFNTKLYTGSNSTQSVTGVGFQPDLVWIKNRSSTPDHMLNDAVRTAGKQINSNTTGAELDRTYFQSFNSDGFSLDGNVSDYNQSGSNFASWNWKANGAGSANTDGTINSTVSVNTTAGFSIVKYTGTDVAGDTVGHGLGAVPKMIILKRLVGSGYDWVVYHKDKTAGLYLNSTGINNDSSSNNIWFNGTAPTSSVFSIGTDGRIGDATNFIAYCFAEKTGYNKFGSYKGNGNADGSFIYTGFKPAFVIIKGAVSGDGDAAQNWELYDNKRIGHNPNNYTLFPNTTAVDSDGDRIDLLSNGFKIRINSDGVNDNNSTYIYMAFGQSIVGSNNIPCTAR